MERNDVLLSVAPYLSVLSVRSVVSSPSTAREVTSFSLRESPRIVLLQLEDSAAYNLIVDHDVYLIGALPECARAQIVDVLTAIDSEE